MKFVERRFSLRIQHKKRKINIKQEKVEKYNTQLKYNYPTAQQHKPEEVTSNKKVIQNGDDVEKIPTSNKHVFGYHWNLFHFFINQNSFVFWY